ncbi:hypothetical protein B0H14DRAFT_2556677 [Mycena olivaceomarginata]|nr:hypothetical protein B0H14DRAFT_2556677 [Mycena olivaceomarginata]
MTATPDVTAPHPPVDPASIESYLHATPTEDLCITRAERRIRRTMGEYRKLIGTADRDRGERYIDIDKILATTPPHVIISYDPTNLIVPKYHSACSFYDVGQTDGKGSER